MLKRIFAVLSFISVMLSLPLPARAAEETTLFNLPDVSVLRNWKHMETSFVYGKGGSLIGCYYIEKRTVLASYEIPKVLEHAIIASEDKHFYYHKGIDPLAVGRAAWKDILARKIVEGGSSLTQQVAKNYFLNPEKSFKRKIYEALLTNRIEWELSKREILTLYVNKIFLGRRSYGFESAARSYFGKPVKNLSIAEAAFIVGLISKPTLVDSGRMPEALQKKNRVLSLMYAEKYITKDEYSRAYWQEIKLAPEDSDCAPAAPHFVEEIRKQYKDSLPLLTGGLRIETSIDINIQKKAETALRNGLAKYRARQPQNADKAEAAVVMFDIKTGEVVAMVGGENFDKSEFNNVTQAHRQPGSTFKPFADAGYLKYVCKGKRENCTFRDSPFPVSMGSGRGTHYVQNYPYSNLPLYRGVVGLDIQLAESRNAASMWMAWETEKAWARALIPVKLAEHEAKREERIAYYLDLKWSRPGAERMYEREHELIAKGVFQSEERTGWLLEIAKDSGINSTLAPYLVTAIGASEVTLFEITSAFIPFVNGGYKVGPEMVKIISDSKGRPLFLPVKDINVPAFDKSPEGAHENARIAENMKELLQGVVDGPTGTAHALRKTFPEGDIACKTGTATNARTGGKAVPTDNWIICATPKYAVGVWMGLKDKDDMGNRETGATNALPIFAEIMRDMKLIDPLEKFEPVVELFAEPDTKEHIIVNPSEEEPEEDDGIDLTMAPRE